MTNVSDFDFDLPPELIAQSARPRGESRLLVLDRRSGAITHAQMRDLPGYLRRGDVLVANDTRVFPARLLGRRVPPSPQTGGGAVECLLLERDSVLSPSAAIWQALVHPGQKLKPGARVRFSGPPGAIEGEILERLFFGRRKVRLWTPDAADLDARVDALGHIPLPPYIRRPDTPDDHARYQTVFAAHRGSIAAPTAGLHFDAALLEALDRAGIERTAITLHVGYGTFKPVRAEHVEDHLVDPEPYAVADAAASRINAALDEGRRIVAVGTTTTRALEDAARRHGGRLAAGKARAEIFIHPGVPIRVISGLMTNFHLPRSSLLFLVSAFAGRDHVLAAYREAIARGYRFYSYGDAMLIV